MWRVGLSLKTNQAENPYRKDQDADETLQQETPILSRRCSETVHWNHCVSQGGQPTGSVDANAGSHILMPTWPTTTRNGRASIEDDDAMSIRASCSLASAFAMIRPRPLKVTREPAGGVTVTVVFGEPSINFRDIKIVLAVSRTSQPTSGSTTNVVNAFSLIASTCAERRPPSIDSVAVRICELANVVVNSGSARRTKITAIVIATNISTTENPAAANLMDALS